MYKNKGFIPSVLIPEIFKPSLDKEDYLPELVDSLSEEGFYCALEIAPVYDSNNRKKIKQIVTTKELTLVMWMTNIIDEHQLDLSSPDKKRREKDVNIFLEYINLATECGAHNIALISGPFHGEEKLTESMSGFIDSLITICKEAAKNDLKVLVEPLDRSAHKKKFMGPTTELVEIIKKVRNEQPNIAIAFDTAHAALNSENIESALSSAFPYTEQIHLSNAVLDKENRMYGDHHMVIDNEGFLTQHRIEKFLKNANQNGYLNNGKMRISVEMRTPEDQDSHYYENIAKNILKQGLQILK
ncbi:sugar phosphate isomerase/epimerase family protein [Oceanobacillus locisalsi]|uniref:Sugar phosphate isomerase/epimerase family protein n=1 Tax=Oceanobacillus locisalsi TaxID=546107 RepID=A0ABW3NFB1_9BACI